MAKPFGTYIDSGNDRLRGNFSWTYSDDADDRYTGLTPGGEPTPLPAASDEVDPSSGEGTSGATWAYPRDTEAAGATPGRSCPASAVHVERLPHFLGPTFTSGNDNWQHNRKQAGTQAHYFVSRFHDHLLGAAGIGFDHASGNFEQVAGSDPVHTTFDVGASTGAGAFPDPFHTNNASMLTLPDGLSPLMQMFLFTGRDEAGVNDVNGADDAQVVLHEYTHGLSNRLVCCDADGFGQLNSDQAGAMGEAWSDWYMFDYLEGAGFQADTAAPGQLVQGGYEDIEFVSEASDCPVGSTSANCPNGGYTYADFGQISGLGPEVHADGEIWVQTLWDLRTRLIGAHGRADGITRARRLITGGMRRSPGEPDFLDMRDAILATDTQLQGGSDRTLIRQVFAARGMGGCAASSGGSDTTPTANFSATGCAFAAGATGTGRTAPGGAAPGGSATQPRLLSDIGFGGFPGRRTSLRRVLRRGLRGRISCDADCGFRAALVLPRRSARKARFRGRNPVVSRLSSSDAAGGSGRRVRFRFSRRTARKLRRLTRGTAIELRVTATDSRGTKRTEKKKLRLRR